MSSFDINQLRLMAALAEQIYHRDEDDFPITLTDLGVSSAADIVTPAGLTPFTGDDHSTAYYSPRGFVGEVVSSGDTLYVVFRGTDLSTSFSVALSQAVGASQTAS